MLETPRDGWHDTGDIVAIDENGFVSIKGRAKRFAKIGGEMVSLAAVEALAAELWPKSHSAATTEIDPRKGERIVLVTQEAWATRADFQSFAKAKGAADLMIPAEVIYGAEYACRSVWDIPSGKVLLKEPFRCFSKALLEFSE